MCRARFSASKPSSRGWKEKEQSHESNGREKAFWEVMVWEGVGFRVQFMDEREVRTAISFITEFIDFLASNQKKQSIWEHFFSPEI